MVLVTISLAACGIGQNSFEVGEVAQNSFGIRQDYSEFLLYQEGLVRIPSLVAGISQSFFSSGWGCSE